MGFSSDPDQRRLDAAHSAWVEAHGNDDAFGHDDAADIFDGRATGFGFGRLVRAEPPRVLTLQRGNPLVLPDDDIPF